MSYQVPRGTQDILPNEISKWHRLEELIRQFTYVYNYQEIRTPIFEHTNVFKRGNDSSDMVNKEMYTFQLENSSTSLTLRPEGTAGVARAFVEHKMYGYADLPMKMYYVGPQCHHERPQKGRMRIFNQFGVEVIGAKSPLLDVETIALGWSFISALGLKDMKVLINTLGDDASRAAYREALKEHFKNDIDHMCTDCKRRYEQNPLRILDCKVDHDLDVMKQVPKMADYLNEESKAYFEQVLEGLDALGIPYEVDDKLVRGLDYYTHTVFEVVSVNKEMGAQSTVFAGGRYDGLVEYFGGPEGMSGIGWAMGLERLLIALEAEGISLVDEDSLDMKVVPQHVRVYEISGPLFFGAADKILDIQLKDFTKCLVLRMRGVSALDSTAMNSLVALYEKCKARNVKLVLSHVNQQPMEVMKKAGFYEMVGEENFCEHIDKALEVAAKY